MLTKASEQLAHLFQLMGYPQALSPVIKLFDGVTIDVSDGAALRIAEQRVGQTTRAFLNGIAKSAGAYLIRKSQQGEGHKAAHSNKRISIEFLAKGVTSCDQEPASCAKKGLPMALHFSSA